MLMLDSRNNGHVEWLLRFNFLDVVLPHEKHEVPVHAQDNELFDIIIVEACVSRRDN